jgi:Arc/MetJ family transcription regulator
MTKHLVDIDDETLAEARRALGTTTLKETVDQSLRSVVKSARRRQITEEDIRRAGELMADLGNPEIMARAWN